MTSFLPRDGLRFHYLDVGQGVPFVFQHGLGGDVNQSAAFRPLTAGVRFLALDCRGHGETRPLGDPEKIGFDPFADDVLALLDHRGVAQAVVGGISMGAGVALNFTLRYPGRVLGLVLSRPAWLDRPLPDNLQVYPRIAGLIRRDGVAAGLAAFQQSAEFAAIRAQSPDAAASLVGQFEHPRAAETVVKLERIPRDAPHRDRQAWTTVGVPTLVLGNRQDPIHPWEYAQTLAGLIPGAVFRELTPKSVSQERHTAETRQFLEEFFHQRIRAC